MLKYIVLIIALVPSVTHANFQFSPSVSVFKNAERQSQTQVEFRAGYEFESGLYVGGFYSLAYDKYIDNVNQYFLGPQIGYAYNGFYGLAGYTLTGESDLASGGIKYSRPQGYQASVGYRMALAPDVYLAPEITWRHVEFKSREVQGFPQGDSGREDTHVLPSITFMFNF